MNKVKRKENPGADGTTEDLLLRAIVEGSPRRLGLHARAITTSDRALAIAALRGLLEEGAVSALAVDCDTHWVSAIGRNGGRFLIADGSDNTGEVVRAYRNEQLAGRWENPVEPPSFFMIAVWVG